jgi:cytochrome c556
MNARTLCSGVVALTVVAAVSGCAMMKQRAPEEVVAERQELMKQQGKAWKDIQDKAKAGDIQGIAPSAETLVTTSQKITALFPEGSMTPKSNAKPEIWQKKPEFDAAAKNLESEAARLRDTAKSGNADATQAIVKDFGRTTCGKCHTPFRVPPKQQG